MRTAPATGPERTGAEQEGADSTSEIDTPCSYKVIRLMVNLMVNVGIVLVFAAFYLRFLKRP